MKAYFTAFIWTAIGACAENRPVETAASGYTAPIVEPSSDPMSANAQNPMDTSRDTTKRPSTSTGTSLAGNGTVNGGTGTPPANATTNNPRENPQGAMPSTPPSATTPDTSKAADNTKNNQRDRNSGSLTPINQGNSVAETQVTATIRKGVVADKSLSINAKNVKIITVGTKVTLRGPVKSEQERATIEVLARQTTGVTEVDNQLEIKN
jgi:hyperosmotically inducible periplasmic protein